MKVGALGVAVLTATAVAVSALALYGVWAFWPSEALPQRQTAHVFAYEPSLRRSILTAVAVACAGVLGALPRALRSLETRAGNRELRWRAVLRSLVPLGVGSAAGLGLFVLL